MGRLRLFRLQTGRRAARRRWGVAVQQASKRLRLAHAVEPIVIAQFRKIAAACASQGPASPSAVANAAAASAGSSALAGVRNAGRCARKVPAHGRDRPIGRRTRAREICTMDRERRQSRPRLVGSMSRASKSPSAGKAVAPAGGLGDVVQAGRIAPSIPRWAEASRRFRSVERASQFVVIGAFEHAAKRAACTAGEFCGGFGAAPGGESSGALMRIEVDQFRLDVAIRDSGQCGDNLAHDSLGIGIATPARPALVSPRLLRASGEPAHPCLPARASCRRLRRRRNHRRPGPAGRATGEPRSTCACAPVFVQGRGCSRQVAGLPAGFGHR